MAGKGDVKNLTNAGKGRKKGVQNKMTTDVKAMILKALDGAGGQGAAADRGRRRQRSDHLHHKGRIMGKHEGVDYCTQCGGELADQTDTLCPACEEIDSEVRREEEAADA